MNKESLNGLILVIFRWNPHALYKTAKGRDHFTPDDDAAPHSRLVP
jgi:hypothetical protein